MTWKRTIAIIASLIWIAICAASVFAQDLVAAPPCVDICTVSALAFDDIHLEELLKIDMTADASIFVNSTIMTTTIGAADTVCNVYPSADCLNEIDTTQCAETVTFPESSQKKSELTIQTTSPFKSRCSTNIRASACTSTTYPQNVRANLTLAK